jgi:thymidylate synthase (FAD)
MKVQLIDYTGAGSKNPARYAAERLVFTKKTRLTMDEKTLEAVERLPWPEIESELEYMSKTIPSSWEFITYTFLINDVTRGFTHQFVRTRTGSYAQQTMRVLRMCGWGYGTGPTIKGRKDLSGKYDETMGMIDAAYSNLIKSGAAIEDARGVLPTNIHTNIVAKFDLRVMADMLRKRASSRTQGEYREVLEGMKSEILRVHPWASLFLSRDADISAQELEKEILALDIPQEKKVGIVKLIDQMRQLS